MPIFAALTTALPSLISTGAGIAGNVITGNNSANAIKNAAAAQAAAAGQAQGVESGGLDAIIQALNGQGGALSSLFAPYTSAGSAALNQQMQLLGLGSLPQGGSAAPSAAGQSAFQVPQQMGAPNYSAYVTQNPDILQAYNTYGKEQGTSLEDFGKWHWNTFGQAEVAAGNPNRTYTPYGPVQPAQTAQTAQAAGAGAAAAAPAAAPAAPAVDPAQQQQMSIDQLKASPLYQSLYHNGEQAVLANAAATGGLRGGNAETSLYNLGNNTLAQVIQQQLTNLGGISGNGQQAAGTQGSLMNQLASLFSSATTGTGANIANIITGAGNNTASAGIAGAGVANQQTNSLTGGISSLLGNSQLQPLLQALGLGGGGIQTSTSNILGGSNLSGQGVAPLSLNTTLPSLNF